MMVYQSVVQRAQKLLWHLIKLPIVSYCVKHLEVQGLYHKYMCGNKDLGRTKFTLQDIQHNTFSRPFQGSNLVNNMHFRAAPN